MSRTLDSILGLEITADPEIGSRVSGLPNEVVVDVNGFTDDPPVGLAMALANIARRAATLALQSMTWRAANLPVCAQREEIDSSCAREAIAAFGSKVMRRDLSSDELDDHFAFYRATGAGNEGLAYVMRRMLQSPPFVFHIETGGTASDRRIRLTDFEVASRISYLVADSPPDNTLMKAARDGRLRTIEEVRAQVERLMETDAAKAKLRDFFRFYARIGEIPDPAPATAALIGIESPVGLGAQMRQEAFDFFEHVFWSEDEGTFSALMTSPAAFPRTDALATIFGTEPAAGSTPATATSHLGLLHRPALLTSPTLRTSPITRGAHVRKTFLCATLGTPSPSLISARQEAVGNIENMSNRDKTIALTDSPQCAGCHGLINPLGFAFENYDSLGSQRSEEVVLDSAGQIVASWPIDTEVIDSQLDADGDDDFADSSELARAMAQSDRARACFTQRMFEYYRTSQQTPTDACLIDDTTRIIEDQSLASALVTMIANDHVFWRKEP